MSQCHLAISGMTDEEESAFVDSFIDYTGGSTEDLLPTGPEASNLSPNDAPGLSGVQALPTGLDVLRSTHGQSFSGTLLELKQASIEAEQGTSMIGTRPSKPLGKLLAFDPLAREPVAALPPSVQLTQNYLEPHLNPKATVVANDLSSTTTRRRLHTPADKLSNNGHSLYTADLDPTVSPDLEFPVWVSCFTD